MTVQEFTDFITLKTEFMPPKHIYYKRLGKVLREHRTNRGINLDTLADATGISKMDLRHYEDGVADIAIYELWLVLGFLDNAPISASYVA